MLEEREGREGSQSVDSPLVEIKFVSLFVGASSMQPLLAVCRLLSFGFVLKDSGHAGIEGAEKKEQTDRVDGQKEDGRDRFGGFLCWLARASG